MELSRPREEVDSATTVYWEQWTRTRYTSAAKDVLLHGYKAIRSAKEASRGLCILVIWFKLVWKQRSTSWSSQSRVGSLIIDEMRIKPKLQYNKQRDCFVGHMDMGAANETGAEPVLAKLLLCFIINGLFSLQDPGFLLFFTKGLNGKPLSTLIG